MTEKRNQPGPGEEARDDARRDLAEHERPEAGPVGDEDLPEDLPEDLRRGPGNRLARDLGENAPVGPEAPA